MQETYNNESLNDFEDEIDLKALFYVLLEGKWIILSVTAFVSIVGVIVSLLLPNIYESKALLAPVDAKNSIARSLGGYGSLAGLAGISLPPAGLIAFHTAQFAPPGSQPRSRVVTRIS